MGFKNIPLVSHSPSGWWVESRRLDQQWRRTPAPSGAIEPRKKPSYFPLNPGWLIGILISWFMKYFLYNWVVFHPLYNPGPTKVFFMAQLVMKEIRQNQINGWLKMVIFFQWLGDLFWSTGVGLISYEHNIYKCINVVNRSVGNYISSTFMYSDCLLALRKLISDM